MKTLASPTVIHRRRSSDSSVTAKRQQERKAQQRQSPDRPTFRSRDQTLSCNSYFAEHAATKPYMKNRVFTENAKDLSPEQLLALEMDIFKPLNFYEILFNRMKAKDNAKADRQGWSSWLLKIMEAVRAILTSVELKSLDLLTDYLSANSFQTLHERLFV